MRSKLGTKSRLAAHILALILLLMMLVYIVPATGSIDAKAPWTTKNFDNLPPAGVPPGSGRAAGNLEIATSQPAESGTITHPKAPAATKAPESGAMKPPGEKQPSTTKNIEPAPPESRTAPAAEPAATAIESAAGPTIGGVDATVSAEPEAKTESGPGTAKAADTAAIMPGPDAKITETAAATSADGAKEEVTAEPASIAPGMTGTDDANAEAATAAGEDAAAAGTATAGQGTGEVLEPLPNTNLQVLGDGVYWLNPEYDLEKELSAIPEIGTLIYLTNMPGLKPRGFEHVKTAIIPADAADLTIDAGERFLHLADSGAAPVVAAILPGARGAAYFKGVYLLTNRKLGLEETLREIGDELEDAGTTADEIIHRLRRFAGKGQKANSGQNEENTEQEHQNAPENKTGTSSP